MSKRKNKQKYSSVEKSIWKKGFFAGLFAKKRKKQPDVKTKSSNNVLHSLAEDYRKSGLGAMKYHGKIYDVNHKGNPSLITQDDIKDLRVEYGMGREYSDLDVAEKYTQHMRRKFGVFDKNGKFLHLMGEE